MSFLPKADLQEGVLKTAVGGGLVRARPPPTPPSVRVATRLRVACLNNWAALGRRRFFGKLRRKDDF